MATAVITDIDAPRQHRTHRVGHAITTTAAITLHLVLAVIVLAIRIPYALLGIAARAAAYTELYLAQHTGRPPFGQTAGAALTQAFAAEFHTAYHASR